jgi:hypothetical protein
MIAAVLEMMRFVFEWKKVYLKHHLHEIRDYYSRNKASRLFILFNRKKKRLPLLSN